MKRSFVLLKRVKSEVIIAAKLVSTTSLREHGQSEDERGRGHLVESVGGDKWWEKIALKSYRGQWVKIQDAITNVHDLLKVLRM